MHTQMEKDSNQRILRQLPSGSRAVGSCFSSGHQTQEGLYFSTGFLYVWLLAEEMLQINPIYSQQCWLLKGNHLGDSLQERPKPHRIRKGPAIRQNAAFSSRVHWHWAFPRSFGFCHLSYKGEVLPSFLLLASRLGGGHPEH